MGAPVTSSPFGDCLHHEKITTATAVGFTDEKVEYAGRVAKAVLITCETADVRFTMDGTTPVITATGGGVGHILAEGQSFIVNGNVAIKNFQVINAVNASGGIIRCSYFY